MNKLYRVYVSPNGMVTEHKTFKNDDVLKARHWFVMCKRAPALQNTDAVLYFASQRKVIERHYFSQGENTCVH